MTYKIIKIDGKAVKCRKLARMMRIAATDISVSAITGYARIVSPEIRGKAATYDGLLTIYRPIPIRPAKKDKGVVKVVRVWIHCSLFEKSGDWADDFTIATKCPHRLPPKAQIKGYVQVEIRPIRKGANP